LESPVSHEPLSSLDLSFLRLEGRDTPMHLGAVLVFGPADEVDGSPGAGPERLAAELRARVVAVPRLRRRLAPTGPGYAWVEDPGFDPTVHVRHSRLPAPAGPTELAAATGALMASRLRRDRPLWELHVLGPLADGGTAVVIKLHHALADGLRAVGLGITLFDTVRTGPGDTAEPGRRTLSLVPPVADVDGSTGQLMGALGPLLAPTRLLPGPRTVAAGLMSRAGQARDTAGIAAAVLRTTLRDPAPPSPLNTAAGPGRRFAMLRADLDEVHRVRKHHGGTVNDVALAVVAGGLRQWLGSRGHLPTAPLRVLVPVSRPHPDPADVAGNRLSGYLVDLPTDQPDPLTRLHTIREAMVAHKATGHRRGAGAFPLLADLMPTLAHRLTGPLSTALTAPLAATAASRLFNTVVTNVPLPDLGLSLAGARLTEVYPVVPLAPGQTLGVALTTYRGTLHLGLHAGPGLPDLNHLGQALTAALTELTNA
jgi:diacylglycerol O-acyltransferase